MKAEQHTPNSDAEEHGGILHSLVRNADPRLKVASVLVWSTLLALSDDPGAVITGLAGSLLLLFLSAQPLWAAFRRLLAVNGFVLFLWAVLPFSFSVPGEVIASAGPLHITREGVALAWLLTLKGNAVALGAIAFFGSSSAFELATAARALGFPEKLAALFLLMARYTQVIGQEYERLRTAMKARGCVPGMNRRGVQACANLVSVLLLRSLDRAERVHAAMRCRGYSGSFPLASEFRPRKRDALFILVMAALISAVVVPNVI